MDATLLKPFVKGLIFRFKTDKKQIHLTFDDGPHPTVTPYVLDVLDEFQAKATFFLIGKHVAAHRQVVEQLIEKDHAIGNHTYGHVNGWRTRKKDYLENVEMAQQELEKSGVSTKLFRPPYGKFSLAQARAVGKTHKIIMWDVLTKDYDHRIDPAKMINTCMKKTRPGSVAIFHDSAKAFDQMKTMLPTYLRHFSELGYTFEPITS